ncbi:MAG: flagellar basal body-associated FliL family protein [Lachnospiraceae bacterium]|jgi:flagellar basal body-associated protein FliL|nr:flagellar basal body-associated FliL family protein [Lachnospiraceae bacterium]
MKKSLINIITLSLSIVNLIFMVVIVFAIVPTMNNTNEFIKKISTAVDLELENSYATKEDISNISVDKLDVYDISKQLVFNLKKGADGRDCVIVVNVSLLMNIEHKDYATYSATLAEKESLFTSTIIRILSSYTMDEVRANTDLIREEILQAIQDMYQSDFIIDVNFSDIKYQQQ